MPRGRGRASAKGIRLAGGRFRGRKLRSGPGIRPLPALVRQSMFQILGGAVEGARALDLFAGAGAAGLEALGRGAQSAAFVELARGSLEILRDNVRALGVEAQTRIVSGDVRRVLNSPRLDGGAYDLVFICPPYDKGLCAPALQALRRAILSPAGALVVVQASPRETLPDAIGVLRRWRRESYGGDCLLHFYALAEVPSETPSGEKP